MRLSTKTTKLLHAACALVAWSSFGSHAADHVLSITLSEYAPLARLESLDGVQEDRRSALKIAQRLGFDTSHAVEITNSQATLFGIRNALDRLEGTVKSNDRVFVYYSGHGGTKRVSNVCQSTLVTYEDEDLLSSELHARLQRIRGKLPKQLFVMLDACHSGEFVDQSFKSKGLGTTTSALRPKMRKKAKDGLPACNAPVNFINTRMNTANRVGKGRSVAKGTFNEASGGQMVMFSAAKDNELAWDSDHGGAATSAALSCLTGTELQPVHGSNFVSVDELRQCVQVKINTEQPLAIRQHVVAQGQTTAPWIPTVAPSLSATVPSAAEQQMPMQVAAPHLQATIVIAGLRLESSETFALPSDSVFALNLHCDFSGHAAVYAVNPAGQTSQIWSTQLVAGQEQQTPDMRLQGMRGKETLRIVFRADAVASSKPISSVVREINILHQ